VRAVAGAGKAGEREADKALVAVLAAAIVLLLLAGNVQLWRLADRGEGGGSTSARPGSTLPPPTTGTSNEVLEKQMRQLSAEMTAPLNGLSAQLGGLQGAAGAQREVAKQIAAMSASIRSFGAVRGEIGQMSNGLGAMVANTSAMNKGLNTMGRDMRATRRGMNGMVRVMRRVEGGIAATSASSREASEGIGKMSGATAAMAESIAATAANGKEMTAALGALNQNMSALLQLFCVAFNSNMSQCGEQEAMGSATAESEQGTVEKSAFGALPLRQGLGPALRLGPAVGH
jgi:hypothetical protein